MKTYTVIGVYEDNDYQRWAESFQAEDVKHAEEQAIDSAESAGGHLIIAGVFLGKIQAVG